jgi:hypothetical protein
MVTELMKYLPSECDGDYKNNNYEITDDISSIKNFRRCDIVIEPFIDFSMRPGDSLTYHRHWSRLDTIVYDKHLSDSIYKFRRFRGVKGLDNIQTVIYASAKAGILGVYDTSSVYKDDQIRVNAVGFSFKKDSLRIASVSVREPSVTLSYVKELKRATD